MAETLTSDAAAPRRLRLLALVAVTAVAAAIVFSRPAIPQDPAYHRFADGRTLLGVPNFWNVASNAPFLVVGLVGLVRLRRRLGEPDAPGTSEKGAWLSLFLGLALTAFGSSWYHLAPSNATLLWDRLPMTLGFMGFLAGVLGERIGRRAYRLLFWPLLGLGVASVLYWYASEMQGAGDLRLYALVQFFPLLIIPLVMTLYQPRYSHGRWIFLALGCYAASKVLEYYDGPIYEALGFGGHALKHFAAAAGCLALLHMFTVRARL